MAVPRRARPCAGSRTGRRRWMPPPKASRPPPALSRSFFSTRATRSIVLGCTSRSNSSWNNRRQLACPDRLTRNKLCPEKRQDLALDLMRTAGATLLGHQPRDARFLEVRLGLVISRPRDTVLVGSIGHRSLLDETRRSISYLTCTASRGSKKSPSRNLGSRTFSGAGFNVPSSAEGVSLRRLTIIVCRHVKLRESECRNRNYKYAALDIPCQGRKIRHGHEKIVNTQYSWPHIGAFAASIPLHLRQNYPYIWPKSHNAAPGKDASQDWRVHQVHDPKECASLPHNDFRIRGGRVGPLRWNRANGLVVDTQQQTLAGPVIPLSDADELPAAEWVERMRYPHKLRRNDGKACIPR